MTTPTLKRVGRAVLQISTLLLMLSAPGVQADEFGDDPPICMKKPYLPQCNPEQFDPPPQDPWPCDFSPFGCGWF